MSENKPQGKKQFFLPRLLTPKSLRKLSSNQKTDKSSNNNSNTKAPNTVESTTSTLSADSGYRELEVTNLEKKLEKAESTTSILTNDDDEDNDDSNNNNNNNNSSSNIDDNQSVYSDGASSVYTSTSYTSQQSSSLGSTITGTATETGSTTSSALLPRPHQEILDRSVKDARVLIGWRVLVPGSGMGMGTILSLKKKKFASTRFVVQFENGRVEALKLQRSQKKGNVPFTLISKVN